MFFIIIAILTSTSQPTYSISCSKIPLLVKLSKNIVYTYNNSISIATWPEGFEVEEHILRQKDSFKTLIYPRTLDSSKGYNIVEVNFNSENSYLLNFLGKAPNWLPTNSSQLYYPIGVIKEDKNNNAQILKHIKCNEIFQTSNEDYLEQLDTHVQKESINKVTEIENVMINNVKTPVLHIETRTKVYLRGKMEGKGTEIEKKYLIADTRELYMLDRTFKYNYDIGFGSKRHREIMSGQYIKKLIGKSRKREYKTFFENKTSKHKDTHYYSNNYGIFIPVKINTTLETQFHISTTENSSYIYYDFFNTNFILTKDNFYNPVERLFIGKNILINPKFNIIEKKNISTKFDTKIPGTIGNNILSLGVLRINDKKRTLSFYESTDNKIPDKAVLFRLINNVPVFNSTVNGQQVNTTISLDSNEHYLSYKFKKLLDLKTRKLTLSKRNPEKNIIEKATVIMIPPHHKYSRTEVIISNFEHDFYDLKLGLKYFKNKILTINYKNKWFLIE